MSFWSCKFSSMGPASSSDSSSFLDLRRLEAGLAVWDGREEVVGEEGRTVGWEAAGIIKALRRP